MNVPAIARREAERGDELLHRTGDAARRLLASIRRYPAADRARRLRSALAQFDSGLPARVERMASALRQRGMDTELAVERAVAIGLADSSVGRIKDLGRRARGGQPLGPLVAGLGTTTTPPASGPSEGDIVAGMFQGIICSGALQNAITDTVGRNEGRDAANATGIGFAVGQGLAQCSSLTPPLPPVAPPTETSGSGLLVPVVVGVGVLAAVGGVLWWTTRKKAN